MYDTLKAYEHFDSERFAEELFQNNEKDPFHKRLANIRSWSDVRYDGGLSQYQCNPELLREGYMSEALHDYLERKIGAERLKGYFGDGSTPKKTKEQQEEDDLITMMFGSVNDYSRLRLHRLGKGNI